jgi:hypothetical protein
MSEGYAWFATVVFALCLIGGVASYLWDDNYLLWPTLFAVVAVAVVAPLVVVRPLRAMLASLRGTDETSRN